MAVAASPANMVRAADILRAEPAEPGAFDAAQDPADPVAIRDNEGGPIGLNGHAPADMPASVMRPMPGQRGPLSATPPQLPKVEGYP
jgi:hypothetical protein